MTSFSFGVLFLALGAVLLSSCASRQVDLPSPIATQQEFTWAGSAPLANPAAGFATIIKFKPSIVTQSDVDILLDELARTFQTQIFYGRPMALGMHVIRVAADSTEAYEALIARLKSHPMVEFAEPDSIVRKSRS
jgi:hypothetical protein